MANRSDRFVRADSRGSDLKSEIKKEVARVSECGSRAQYRSNGRDRSYDSPGRSSPRGSPSSGRRDKGGDVGYDRRSSSRRSGGSRDSSYERYGSRDISRERYRSRESPREMRDKFSRYRDKNDVELQNLPNKSDRESEVKKGHTGQDWWTCKTKGVKSSEYVEVGSQQGTAQGIRDVQVSMEYDREHSHDGVREGAEKVAEPGSVMEKVCSFLAEVSSNGMLDRESHEKKVAKIEREEREVWRKSKEKFAKLKVKRETAVMELENVKAFRVVVQKGRPPVDSLQQGRQGRQPVEVDRSPCPDIPSSA
ncbi:arginine and glutamate-rich protein 1-like [Watersipora subatra]|uniref:arginine and glutamate-rich protein 1-like n=1 Tax=Watersipora subatra TaxID=2589382 RepID=UPI00355BAF26